MPTLSGAAWRAVTDPALKVRLIHGRNTRNWARQRLARTRQREVRCLWHLWQHKYAGRRGLQKLIAEHLGTHKSTVCRDVHALGLRTEEPMLDLARYLDPLDV